MNEKIKTMTKTKGKVKIVKFIRKTSGGTHGWYEVEITGEDGKTSILEIRKPLRAEDK